MASTDSVSLEGSRQKELIVGLSDSSSQESISEGRSWCVKNPRAAVALKFTAIGLVFTLIIGALVGIGASGGFGPEGWLQQTALPAIKQGFEDFGFWVKHTVIPAIREFLDTIPDLNVWQGFAYIAAPILGAGIIAGVSYKYIVPACKKLHAERQEAAAQMKQAEDQPGQDLLGFKRVFKNMDLNNINF